MRIVHLSDTHGKHSEMVDLPTADIIVHSGDFTMAGSEQEAYDFMNWFCDLNYKHKVFIAGNHDDCMYGASKIDGLPENVHYLMNSGVEIEGLKFYGVPLFMQDCMDGSYEGFFEDIPDDTDILVTHQPPMGIMDLTDYGTGKKHHGNLALMNRIDQLHLKYHLFGHEHETNGIVRLNDTVFSNAAVLDRQYEWQSKPRVIQVK